MGGGVVLIVAVGDKVHQKGQRILQSGDVVEQVVNHDNPASLFYKRQLDTVDKDGTWSYFNYTLSTYGQEQVNGWSYSFSDPSLASPECVAKTFNTIAEYAACNPN